MSEACFAMHRIRATLMFAAVVACADSNDGRPSTYADWVADVDTIGDTISVHTTTGSLKGKRRLVEQLRIGVVDGPEHEMFGQVGALAVAANGDILIYDAQAKALRRYSPTGEYLGTIGRSGSGPGEYRGVAGMAVLNNGRLVLNDFGNKRLNVYNPQGEILDTWVIGQAIAERRPLYVDSLGRVLALDLANLEGVGLTEVLVRVDDNGAIVGKDVLPRSTRERPSVELSTERGSIGTAVPFTPELQWTVTAAGEVAYAPGDSYQVIVLRANGSTLRISRAVEPIPVSPEERTAEEARVTDLLQRVAEDWHWRNPDIPATKPPIRWLGTGSDGTLWVAVAQPGTVIPEEERDTRSRTYVREPVVFDVYNSSGQYIGEVQAPSEFALTPHPVFSQETVWAVVHDESGVNYVSRFAIEPLQ